jgi:tetratricopeptide (TPR) repeat protein
MMDHPNIARVLDGGLHDGRPFFVMELVKGVPITEYCDKCKFMPRQRLELFVPVCQAIQHAHQKGIIHRDIKPSNVLIALYDDKPVVKVIDFGVAKATGGALTERTIDTGFGGVVGTPQYMSPEQATFNNLDIDTRSDVYALGVLLYELLTGSTPFSKQELEKHGLLEILRVVREEEPPRPSHKLSTADALPSLAAVRGTEPKALTGLLRNELDWIVMKALEKERGRRYETANGFAADVLRFLPGEPVIAHPPSAAYRMKKFVRRNKGQVIAASLVLFALLAGIAGTTWGLFEARQAKLRESARADGEQKAKDAAVEAPRNAEAAAAAEKSAKEREGTQRGRAEKAYARTADVLDSMVSEVAGDSLATQKEISAEQKKFLAEVLTYYQEFAGEKADDENARRRAALAAGRVGIIEARLDRNEESAAALRMARDRFAALAAEFPDSLDHLENLAAGHGNLGLLLNRLGKRTEAEEQLRKALANQEKLAADFPAIVGFRFNLAKSRGNLANVLVDLGKHADGEEQYRKALAIHEKLAAEFPAVANYRYNLAVSHQNLGELLRGQGKRADAEEHYRKGLATYEKLVAELPNVPEYRQDLARIHISQGKLLESVEKRADAEVQYRKGLALQEKLAAEFPTAPEHRHELATSHANIGMLLAGMGKQAEAEEQLRKALAVQEKLAAEFPAAPGHLRDLASSHNSLGGAADTDGEAYGGGGAAPQGFSHPGKAGGRVPRRHRIPPVPGAQPHQYGGAVGTFGEARGGGGAAPPGSSPPGETGRRVPRRHRIPPGTGHQPHQPGVSVTGPGETSRRGGAGPQGSIDPGESGGRVPQRARVSSRTRRQLLQPWQYHPR